MPDDITEVVQPEGQGDEGQAGGPPYADYLSRIPEEVRGDVEPVFKDWDSNVTRRFQEASEYRKQWEPYEQSGVNQLSPEEVQWLVQFRGALDQDPQAVKEWWDQYAQANDLNQPPPAAETPAPPAEDPYGFQDPTAQLLKQQLEPIQQKLEAFTAWQEQQEQTARVREAENYVRGQINEIKAQHQADFDKEKAGFDAEQLLETFVGRYIDADPRNAVPRAWADVVALRNQLEQATLKSKLNQPPPAESGGVVDGSPEPITTLKQAGEIALQQLRQSNLA